jgi:hypothetical protein
MEHFEIIFCQIPIFQIIIRFIQKIRNQITPIKIGIPVIFMPLQGKLTYNGVARKANLKA